MYKLKFFIIALVLMLTSCAKNISNSVSNDRTSLLCKTWICSKLDINVKDLTEGQIAELVGAYGDDWQTAVKEENEGKLTLIFAKNGTCTMIMGYGFEIYGNWKWINNTIELSNPFGGSTDLTFVTLTKTSLDYYDFPGHYTFKNKR